MEWVGNVVKLDSRLTKERENTISVTKVGTNSLTFQGKYEKKIFV